jgi:hypothetical protein
MKLGKSNAEMLEMLQNADGTEAMRQDKILNGGSILKPETLGWLTKPCCHRCEY